jgi:predicted Zn-dependent peptidase
MQIIENSKVKEKLYVEKLENGLTVMIMPKKNIQKKYMIWATNFGSIDNKFIAPNDKEETNIPDGVAHFLEHKMFEQQNGTNSLDTLTALGVNANAYTTTDHTCYLFECTDNFYPAMDELVDYVQNPYFTDQNVEKEKGIIGQEIQMYDDYPSWAVYMNAMKCMYKNNPIIIDIAGSIESISKIDKEVLYKCYNTFYHPSNMVMCFAGDFEPEALIEEVKKRLKPTEKHGEIKRIYPEEPEQIVKKENTQNMEVSMPIFVIGIKDVIDNKNCTSSSIVKKHIAIEILLNMLIGKSSKLYKELYEAELITGEPYLDYEFSKQYAHVSITGQSNDPKKVLEKFEAEIKQMKKNDINLAHFQRVKNMIYGNYVKEYDDVAEICRMFVGDYMKGINSFEYIEEYEQVTPEYTKQVLEEVFKEDKTVLSIVEK